MINSEVSPGGRKEKCDDNLSRMRNAYKNIQSNIKEGEYYCVDHFYIGRVLSVNKKSVAMKFLRKYPVGYKWPSRDDIDNVEVQHIFFGPVIISGALPFSLDEMVLKSEYKNFQAFKKC